jgi:multicomponent Na+:H+ antiporter subunit G
MWTDWLIISIASVGTFFILLAGLGILRMPDFYLRISVTTKAGTLGVGLLLVATAFYFQDSAVTSRVLAIIVFLVLTAPVAAHMIGKAGYQAKIPLWDRSVRDEYGTYQESNKNKV